MRFSGRSFMWIINRPMIEPCGTPVLIAGQKEDLPFRYTFFVLISIFIGDHHAIHTFSKATFRNTPRVLRERLPSNVLTNSRMIVIDCEIQESALWKLIISCYKLNF